MKLFLFFIVVMGCTSKSNLSEKILEKRDFEVNKSINPCENFYEYACSKIENNFKLREDRSRHAFSFDDSAERILDYKKAYFKKLSGMQAEGVKERQIKNVYLACMDSEARESEEKSLVQATLKEMDGILSRRSFIKKLSGQIMSPKFSFIKYDTIPNQNDPERYDLYKDISTMNLPDVTYYKKEKLISAYHETVVAFFKAIGSKTPKADADIILSYEKGFALNFPETKEIRNLVNKKTSTNKNKMIRNFPGLALADSLKKVPKRTSFRSLWPKSLKYMSDYLLKAPLDSLKKVYIYYSLQGYLDEAFPKYYQSYFDFRHKHLGGAVKRSERSERCTKHVMRKFSKEVDYILVPKMFPNFPKQKFIQLAEKVRLSLAEQIRNNKWLAKKTREEALRKITTAKLQLVTPDTIEEWNFTPDAEYSSNKYIENSRIRYEAHQKKMINDLSKKISRYIWGMSPLTVNAYYHPSYNKFVLPLAILQYPFYDPTLPEEVNIGAIGTVIGHELGHAVDDKGSKYNADGLLKNWFTKRDYKNYGKRTSALVKQWDAIGENGKFKLGENIGDLVGLTASYEAAFPKGSNKTNELKQKFFLQYARAWCEVQRPKMAERRLKTDSHSASIHRVNEQVKHQLGFEEAYQCRPGDKMTLPNSKRVRIW